MLTLSGSRVRNDNEIRMLHKHLFSAIGKKNLKSGRQYNKSKPVKGTIIEAKKVQA